MQPRVLSITGHIATGVSFRDQFTASVKKKRRACILVDTRDPLDPVCCVKSQHIDLLTRPHGMQRHASAMTKLA
jgi:hypothetical protein